MASSSHPPNVLITGASSGIGKATALHLARKGYRVAATSRELLRLSELTAAATAESLTVSPFQLDINDPTEVEKTMPTILEQVGELTGLINNAGYGLWGCLEELTYAEVKAQFDTNLFAALTMSQAVLPHMRARGSGTIINVGSVVGQLPIPAAGAYCASKFALEGLSRVMRMEVAPFGVRIAIIEPGLFRTSFHVNRVFGERVVSTESPYYPYIQNIWKNSSSVQRWAADPTKVAKLIEKVLRAKRTRPSYTVGIDAGLGILARRLVPDGLAEFVTKRVAGR